MRESLDRHGLHEGKRGLHINARGFDEDVRQRPPMEIRNQVGLRALEDLAHKRKAVRMQAARGKAQHNVAGHDGLAGDDAVLFDHAHAEAREVVLAFGVHSGHLRGLAADERAAGRLAAQRDALDHVRRHRLVELAAGEIVEEEERLRALDEHVVDAHRDEIDADRVVPVQRECELELGAHAVGARYEHRMAVLLRDLHERAEPADTGEHLGPHGALCERLDGLDQRVALVDVYAGITIRKAFAHGGNREGAPWGVLKWEDKNSCAFPLVFYVK